MKQVARAEGEGGGGEGWEGRPVGGVKDRVPVISMTRTAGSACILNKIAS